MNSVWIEWSVRPTSILYLRSYYYTMDVAKAYYFVADISDESPNSVIDVRMRDVTPCIQLSIGLLSQNYSKSQFVVSHIIILIIILL